MLVQPVTPQMYQSTPTRLISIHWQSNVCSAASNNTGQQDIVPRKVYCVSNVTFHAESKYAIKSFPSPTVFVQWHFYY
jgi:hypothetical protein